METLTIKHKDFKKFCELLEGKGGCSFQQNKEGKTVWKCKGGQDKSLATKILKKHFPDIDIQKTLAYFESKGGYCDCEILWNVYDR